MPSTSEITLLAVGGVAAYALLQRKPFGEAAAEVGQGVGSAAVGVAAGALEAGYDAVADNLGTPLAEAIAGPPPSDDALTMLAGYNAADRTNAKASGTRIPPLDVLLLQDALPLERRGVVAAGWSEQRTEATGFLGLTRTPLVEWTLSRLGAGNVLDGPGTAAPDLSVLQAGATSGAQS